MIPSFACRQFHRTFDSASVILFRQPPAQMLYYSVLMGPYPKAISRLFIMPCRGIRNNGTFTANNNHVESFPPTKLSGTAEATASSNQLRRKAPVASASTKTKSTAEGMTSSAERELLDATAFRELFHRAWFTKRENYAMLFFRLLAAGGLLHMVSEYGFEIIVCEGPSMNPTIFPRGDIILVEKLTPRLFGIQGGCSDEERTKLAHARQDDYDRKHGPGLWHEPRIPVDKLPSRGYWGRFVTKMFSGISVGDVVVVKHIYREGTICKRILGLPGDTVNNPPIEVRQSLPWRSRCQGKTLFTIPDGHMWLEGDNTGNSVDSRNYGPVPVNLLVGRVVARIWPLRGRAFMERGAQPTTAAAQRNGSATTILPAGYQGQEIVKEL